MKQKLAKKDVTVWRDVMESVSPDNIDEVLQAAQDIFLKEEEAVDEHEVMREGNCLQEIALQLANFPGKGVDLLRRCLNHANFRTRVFARQTCLEWPEECLDPDLRAKMGMN